MDLLRPILLRTARPGLHSLVRCVLHRECENEAPRDLAEASADALEERIVGMPAHLSIGMLGLTAAFDFSGLIRGQRAAKMEPQDCAKWMETWRNAPLGPARDFVLFYDKMAAFAFHSIEEENG